MFIYNVGAMFFVYKRSFRVHCNFCIEYRYKLLNFNFNERNCFNGINPCISNNHCNHITIKEYFIFCEYLIVFYYVSECKITFNIFMSNDFNYSFSFFSFRSIDTFNIRMNIIRVNRYSMKHKRKLNIVRILRTTGYFCVRVIPPRFRVFFIHKLNQFKCEYFKGASISFSPLPVINRTICSFAFNISFDFFNAARTVEDEGSANIPVDIASSL